MTWFVVDDSFHAHPKTMSLSMEAIGVWVRAGSWCGQYLTDGAFPRHVFAAWQAPPRAAAELVAARLWHVTEGGWQFHDWSDWQLTRKQVLARREKDNKRKAAGRTTQKRVRLSARNPSGIRTESSGPSPSPSPLLSSSENSLTLATTTNSPSFAPENDQSGGGSIELGPKGTEHEGYRWLHETLGTFPADLASWRADYAAIGAKPAAERLQVARNVQATAWLMEKRSRATPGHLRKHWASFLEGPRNFDQPKPIVAMDFKSQREAAQKAYTKSRLDAFDASEKAFIAMAKTEAERKLRESDWQERRIRLDRSLP